MKSKSVKQEAAIATTTTTTTTTAAVSRDSNKSGDEVATKVREYLP